MMDERLQEAHRIVQNRVWWSVAGGLIPVPIVDMVAVTGVQMSMVASLSNLYDVKFSDNTAKTIVATLLGSIVPNALARGGVGMALKAIPLVGQTFGTISMSIFSGAATYAIGKVFIQHFETGGTLLDFNIEEMREYFKKYYEEGKEHATRMSKDKPAPAATPHSASQPSATSAAK